MRSGPRGQSEELRRVYREHAEGVYAFFAYAVPRSTAEDLTSATFERVIRSWASYDPERASERTWILTIARNLLTDHFRRQRLRQAVSTDEHPALLERLSAGDEWTERVLGADELRQLLGVLGQREQEILALRYGADLAAKEIGAVLGLTPANVHQIISRSLRRLRAEAAESEDLSGSA